MGVQLIECLQLAQRIRAELIGGGYFVQKVNDFHNVGSGLEARDLFVKLFFTENIAQLFREPGRRVIQLEKSRLEVGVRGHG